MKALPFSIHQGYSVHKAASIPLTALFRMLGPQWVNPKRELLWLGTTLHLSTIKISNIPLVCSFPVAHTFLGAEQITLR